MGCGRLRSKQHTPFTYCKPFHVQFLVRYHTMRYNIYVRLKADGRESVSHRRTQQVTQLFTCLLTHKLFSSCIRRYLVSRACDWVMSALSAVLHIFSFKFSLLVFSISLARPQPHCGVLLVLICNIGHQTLQKISGMHLTCTERTSQGKTLNWL